MGRFAKVYTDTQRAAVVRAIVDEKRLPRDVIEAAETGRLAGLEPFTMPITTAYDYARKERLRRARADKQPRAVNADDPAAAAAELRRRVLALAEGYLIRVETKLQAGKLEPKDFDTTTGAVLDIARQIERDTGTAGKGPLPTANGDGDAGIVEQLAASSSTVPANVQGNTGETAERRGKGP